MSTRSGRINFRLGPLNVAISANSFLSARRSTRVDVVCCFDTSEPRTLRIAMLRCAIVVANQFCELRVSQIEGKKSIFTAQVGFHAQLEWGAARSTGSRKKSKPSYPKRQTCMSRDGSENRARSSRNMLGSSQPLQVPCRVNVPQARADLRLNRV